MSKDLTIGCSKAAPWYPKNLLFWTFLLLYLLKAVVPVCSYMTSNATNILHQHDKNVLPRIIFTVFWNNSEGPFTSFYIHQILKSPKRLPTELRGQAHRLLGLEHTGSVLRRHWQGYSLGLVTAPNSFVCVCRTPEHTCQWNF